MNDVLAGSHSNESVNVGMETFVWLLCINQTHSLLGNRSAKPALQAPGSATLILALFVLKARQGEADCGIEAVFMRTLR